MKALRPDQPRFLGKVSRRRRPGRNHGRMLLESLEPRLLLTTPGPIVPGQLYQDVAFNDPRGDTVEISLTGPTSASTGFTVSLAGGATDNADINNINLLGVTAQDSLDIQVTPNAVSITGGSVYYGQMFSAGYVNVASITATANASFPTAPAVTDLGGIHLSAAVVNSIELPGVNVGNITLDTGEVPYVDRVDSATIASITTSNPSVAANGTTTIDEIYDDSPVGQLSSYAPATGLIRLNNIQAQSIASLVINGATTVSPGNPSDEFNTMNDFEGVIQVAGSIGSIVAPNSDLKGTIIAGSIGSANIGIINGTITTTDATQPLTITLPDEFTGFLNSAGHLNLAFPFASSNNDSPSSTPTPTPVPTPTPTPTFSSMLTGQITSGGGISGIDPSSATDPVLVPDQFSGVVINNSTTSGISGIAIDGVGMSRWVSASSIGDITAPWFNKTFIATAGTDIGNIQSYTLDLGGHFQAGGNIGNVTAAGNISADLIAGGNIGNIDGVTGGFIGNVITAGGNIGDISVIQLSAATVQITAGGNIGNISMESGQWDARVQAQNIGNITDASGNFLNAVIVANDTLGNVSVTAKQGDAISGGSIIAGTNMGTVSAYAYEGTAIKGTLIQAGNTGTDQIAGVTGISYGATELPPVTPGATSSPAAAFNGIDAAQILAAQIGPILGQAYVGTGINQAVIHGQVGDIASITGIGNGNGIYRTTVVAEGGIGPITGQSTVQGDGISGGSFDANGTSNPTLGTIGQVTAQGGPAGGDGIDLTRFQAAGRIAGISGTANANGGDGLFTISATANSFGTIDATVLGGQLGNGITNSTFTAWSDYQNNRPGVQIDAIVADVRSALGMGITGTIVSSKGDLTTISSTALNGPAIASSTFSVSRGNFGSIFAQSINGGTAIFGSTFTAGDGSITTATDAATAATSGIVAIADGTAPADNAISGSTFMAGNNIGMIVATAVGGSAINNSTFTADSSYGNSSNGPNLPGMQPDSGVLGAVLGIDAATSGQNLAASAGIANSTFEGQSIGTITADVTDRQSGGPGIIGSTFTARNAVYDGAGNFNNEGTIGAINVTDGSIRSTANGIDSSQFLAGAAGSIGDINVQTLGGVGINASTFDAGNFDYDQSNFNSRIGNINVTTGRTGGQLVPLPAIPNDAWTVLPAGISSSYFAANGGIGNVNVNSIGTGVFFSAFLANSASNLGYGFPGLILPFLAPNVPGDLGNINITSSGRFGAGSVFSVFAGTNVGNTNIQIASRNPNGTPLNLPALPGAIGAAIKFVESLINFSIQNLGPAGSAGSMFVATDGNLGGITIANAGPGASALASAFVAMPKGSYGPLSLTGPSLANMFWYKARTSGSGATTQVTATSITPPASGSYNASAVLTFHVNFSGSVAVTGQPTFPVQVGSTTEYARYQSGSGSSQLLFTMAVNPGDSGNVTIAPGTTIQTDLLNRIVDSATGEDLIQLAPQSVGTSNVVVDTTAPTVTSVSPILATPTLHHGRKYDVGELLSVLVTFNKPVMVTGLPTMAMTIGGLNRSLAYSSGSGTDTLRFTYTIVRADVKTHQTAQTDSTVLLPPGARITDAAGNPASLQTAATTAIANVATQGSHSLIAREKGFHRALIAHPGVRVKAYPRVVGHPALAARAIVAKHGLGIAMGIEPSSKSPFRR